jgi:hypothetical protein
MTNEETNDRAAFYVVTLALSLCADWGFKWDKALRLAREYQARGVTYAGDPLPCKGGDE